MSGTNIAAMGEARTLGKMVAVSMDNGSGGTCMAEPCLRGRTVHPMMENATWARNMAEAPTPGQMANFTMVIMWMARRKVLEALPREIGNTVGSLRLESEKDMVCKSGAVRHTMVNGQKIKRTEEDGLSGRRELPTPASSSLENITAVASTIGPTARSMLAAGKMAASMAKV